MKAKLIISICLVAILCSAVSAQEYSIRVRNNTNLRVSYSLQSSIAEKVPSGTVLSVVDNFNRWLKVRRNSGEVWMADWVGFTRVEGQQTQTSSSINNCCFVDRQCTTGPEWESGYWAFQNNQCVAAVPPQQQTSTQPTSSQPESSAPENIDNCCFVDRQCATDEEWASGYVAYQKNHCGGSSSSPLSGSHGGVKIEGSGTFNLWVESAFDLLRRRAPQWHSYAITGLRKVKQIPLGGGHGILIDTKTYTAEWDSNRHPNDYDIVVLVGGLAHEACHSHQWDDGTATIGWRNELPCMEAELAAVLAVDPGDRFGIAAWARGIIDNIQNLDWWSD